MLTPKLFLTYYITLTKQCKLCILLHFTKSYTRTGLNTRMKLSLKKKIDCPSAFLTDLFSIGLKSNFSRYSKNF